MSDTPPETDKPKAPHDGVPTPLLDELHDANQQFSKARQHVEQAGSALVNPFEERDQASQELRDAERAVEEIDSKIGHELQQHEFHGDRAKG